MAALLVPVARAGHQEWRVGQMLLTEPEYLRDMRAIIDRRDLAQQTVVAIGDALLIQRRATGLGVEARGDEIPHLLLSGTSACR